MSNIGDAISLGILEVGRSAFQSSRYGRIGMSASSRQQLESFMGSANTLFNTLYLNAEDQEANNIRKILALRSQYKHLVSETITETASSTTSGTTVNTEA